MIGCRLLSDLVWSTVTDSVLTERTHDMICSQLHHDFYVSPLINLGYYLRHGYDVLRH